MVSMVDVSADLALPLNSLRNRPKDDTCALFIKQSSRSNYCGVYSTGMLLSLLGFRITRHEALALFNLKRNNPEYPGASYCDIGNVFESVAKAKFWHWEYHRRFNFASVSRSLRTHLLNNSSPTLLSFGAIHKNGEWSCRHMAVVIAVTDKLIELLDPLGNKPLAYAEANVWLRGADGSPPIHVSGCSYAINPKSETAVLHWAAKEPVCIEAG